MDTMVNTLDKTIKEVESQMVGDTLGMVVDDALFDTLANPLARVGAETFCNTLVAIEA